MANLIRADLLRFTKEKIFWIFTIACPLLGLWFGYDSTLKSMPPYYMYYSLFGGAMTIMLILHYGRETHDNAIRNKLICGHSKFQIICSRIAVSLLLCTALTLVYFGCYLIFGYKSLTVIPKDILIPMIPGVCLQQMAWTLMIVLIISIVTIKGVGEIAAICIIYLLALISGVINQKLNIPEFEVYSDVNFYDVTEEEIKLVEAGELEGTIENKKDKDGNFKLQRRVVTINKSPNLFYIKYPERALYEFADRALPSGQFDRYYSCWNEFFMLDIRKNTNPETNEEHKNLVDRYNCVKYTPYYSLLLMGIIAPVGVLIYRKKEIK